MTTMLLRQRRGFMPSPNMWRTGIGLILLITAVFIGIQALANKHAYSRHGDIADYVIKGCKDNKPVDQWKAKDADRFYFVCKTEDNRWGLWVRNLVQGNWDEVTAFILDDAKTSADVAKYLMRSATRFKGPLPPLW